MRESSRPACGDILNFFRTLQFSRNASIRSSTFHLSLASIMFLFGIGAAAQVNVLTQHNDIAPDRAKSSGNHPDAVECEPHPIWKAFFAAGER